MSAHTYLIDKYFLSTFLDEDINDLSDRLTDLSISENVSISDVSDFLVRLEGFDISNDIKLSYLERLTRAYRNSLAESLEEEVDVFNEYAGNPEHNKILLQLMKEMEKNLTEFYDDTLVGIKSLDEILAVCKTEAKKKNPNAKQAAMKVKQIYDRVDKEFSDADGRKRTYAKTFNRLKSICKKFGVRFNDVVMEDKKAFDKKLKAAHDKMSQNEQFAKWLPRQQDGITVNIKDLNNSLDVLVLDSKDTVVYMVQNYINPVYRYMYICMTGYMGNINYLRYILGLEKEDTFFYKAINKIFKTKRD